MFVMTLGRDDEEGFPYLVKPVLTRFLIDLAVWENSLCQTLILINLTARIFDEKLSNQTYCRTKFRRTESRRAVVYFTL